MKVAAIPITVLLMTTILPAQEKPKHIYFLNSGLSLPAKPGGFVDHWKIGPNFGFGIGQWLTPKLTLVGHFGYNRFKFMGAVDYGDPDITIFTIMTCLKTDLVTGRRNEALYLISGLGYFKLASDDGAETNPWAKRSSGRINESNFALYVGPGIDLELTRKFGFFIEIDYSICFSSGVTTEFIALKIGSWLVAF